MHYYSILQQAFKLLTRRLYLCGFGLVLFGGFNLFLINFFAFQIRNPWKDWPIAFEYWIIFVGVLAVIGIYYELNLVKVWFISLVHKYLHGEQTNELKCDLCLQQKNKTISYTKYASRTIIASIITIALTSITILITNGIVAKFADSNKIAIAVNVCLIVIVTTLLGTWNLFTAYFIVFHNFTFKAGAKAAISLFSLRFRRVIEFLFIACALYFLATIIGNGFINIWNHGFMYDYSLGLRGLSLLLFIFWFLFINTIFNIAFIIFFDDLVKTTRATESLEHGQVSPNIVN